MSGTDTETDPSSLDGTMRSARIEGFNNLESGTPVAYRWIYDRIFWDLDHAAHELAGPKVDFANLIHAAAHLRLVLERVVTASFAASHVLFNQASRDVGAAKDFGEMRKSLKRLNPNYWPSAFGEVEHNGVAGLGVRTGIGVAETEVGRQFGLVSTLLHAPNPFKKDKIPPEDTFDQLKLLTAKLQEMLPWHIVQLAESSEFLYLRRTVDAGIVVEAIRTERPLL